MLRSNSESCFSWLFSISIPQNDKQSAVTSPEWRLFVCLVYGSLKCPRARAFRSLCQCHRNPCDSSETIRRTWARISPFSGRRGSALTELKQPHPSPSRIRPWGKSHVVHNGCLLRKPFAFFISPRTKRLRSFETSAGGAGRSLCPVVPDLRLVGVIGRKDYEGVNHNTGARTGFFV